MKTSLAFALLALVGCNGNLVVRVDPNGTIRTPAAARDAIRELRARNGGRLPAGGVTVEFADGIYRLDEPLELDSRDSGSSDAPIVWKAAHPGKASFSGALPLDGWARPSDRKALALLRNEAKDKVLVATVPDGIDIPDFHGGSEEAYSKRLNFPLWLYQAGHRLDCARYPNRPDDPRELKSGYLFTGFLVHGKHGGEFRLRNLRERLSIWRQEPYLWAYGLFLHEYADMKMRVVSVDADEERIKLDTTWYPRGFSANRPFHVFNALSEIDTPGEWVMDRAKRKIYLWPMADVTLHPPVLGATPYLVTGTNLTNVTFRGLAFRHCRRDALRFDGCRNVRVQASTVSLTGAWGVTVQGGSDCRVEGCDLMDLGEGGVRLAGGDWRTLTPARHIAENNHIAHYGEVIPSYRPGVSLSGVGNRCSHNLIHHSRHQAIWFNGNDHYVGYNVVHDTCLYNDDAGAIYCCQRDWTKRGTVIEYNLVHATGKRPHPTNVHCIYLDDWSSGTVVRGNILNQASWGLHFGGGQATVASNNLCVACETWCYLATRRWPHHFPNGKIGPDSSFYRKLTENQSLWETPPWKGRYPNMLDPLAITNKVLAHDPIACDIENNLFWKCGPEQLPIYREILPMISVTNNVACTNDPGFVDYLGGDFNLKCGSPAWKRLGGNSRFDAMGLYDSPLRASPAMKFGADASPVEICKREPKPDRQAAVIRIDVTVDDLPKDVKEIAHGLENAVILPSSAGKRIVGFSEKDEAPYDCHWEQCWFAFVPNVDADATISLSGRFGRMTEYRNVKVTGAGMSHPLAGAANHNDQKRTKLTLKKGVRVRVDFEARAQPDCPGPTSQSPAPAAERVRKYIVDIEDSPWNLTDAKSIRDRAARAMKRRVRPVTEKRLLPKSGNPHDYFSMGTYWWPNPNTTNGLPYVRRDGQPNPERSGDSDRVRICQLANDVAALAAASMRLGDHAAGREAARRLRVFFLDPATRINPHLEYAQAIPGVTDGRGIGIIDTLELACFTVDSILILHGTGDLPDADFEGLRRWFGDYLDWLCNSKNGRDERAAKNNHGSNMDLQCTVYALFTGRKDLAREILRSVPKRRIDVQIEPDGRQPLELERVSSDHYSNLNLDLLLHLALLGESLGVDIWGYESADGRSIRKAAAFMMAHWTGERKWTYRQVKPHTIVPDLEALVILRHFGEAIPESTMRAAPCSLYWRRIAPRSVSRQGES